MTRLMACPPTCGGAAALLVSERFAKKHGLRSDVQILAQAMTTDPVQSFDPPSMLSWIGTHMTSEAVKRVYEEAGVGPEDIDVCELHDCFAQNEVISYETLGFCPEGGAEKFVNDGDNTYGGKVVVNPSGGLLSKGHPLGATGLAQCYELTHQLRGTRRPAPGRRRAARRCSTTSAWAARASSRCTARTEHAASTMDLHTEPERSRVSRRGARLHPRPPARRHPRAPEQGPRGPQAGRRGVAAHPARARLGRAALAAGIRRRRARHGRAPDPRRGAATRRGAAAAALQRRDARAGAAALRHRGTEAVLPAEAGAPRPVVLPGLLGAGFGLGPRLAAHRAPCATATNTWSTARRSGPPRRTMPTGSSRWCAPSRRRASRTASPSC